MKQNREEKKHPLYFLILGLVSIVSGIGNLRYFMNSDSIYDILLGIIGAAAIIGSILLFKEYKRLAKVRDTGTGPSSQ
ncbi:hypothetical protein [Fredinandcohnia sp. FSL W7-1320]|uniref:hypothetical protein n=2 Tax=unclassified Fredinandcohnia TaxID=2837514 RepID=UPI0030FD292B